MAVYKRGGSEPVILGDGGNLLSLEVGKRGIFPNLQANIEESGVDESDTTAGASRSRGFDDRNAVVALSRGVGDAGTAERKPPDHVQPTGGVAGGAS